MSALTLEQAKSIAAAATSKYYSASNSYNLNNHSFLYSTMDLNAQVGDTPEQNLKTMTADIIFFAAYENPSLFPGYTATLGVGQAAKFVESLPSSLVINFLYPQASAETKAAMTTALDSGAISKQDFTFGVAKLGTTNTSPTLADVAKAATVAGLTDSYPDSGLHMPGVTDAQQDFVVAMYAAAFNRAPEYNGLKYWTGKLSTELGYGTDQKTAYSVISKQMYIDGKGNGEGGTSLGDSAYVNYAYQNILGRSGEAAGVSYWNNQLATGAVDRGGFVAQFVGDALGNAGDGDFLQARIAVSKFAAQAHVSGPGAPGIDLSGVIQGVTNSTTATAAINAIIQKYGNAPSAITSLLSSWADADAGSAIVSDDSVATVELSGTATSQGIDLFAA